MRKMKKIIIALLVITLLPGAVFANSFSDVNETDYGWAYKEIESLSGMKILNGYPDGTFKPERPVSFLEVMTIIKTLQNPNLQELQSAMSQYGELVRGYGVDEWAVESVTYLISKGVITEKTLQKARKVNLIGEKIKYPDRNSVSVYFARGLGLDENGDIGLLRHRDLEKIPAITKGYLGNLIKAGIFSSTGSDGLFQGERYITRAETAIITDRSFKYLNNTKEEIPVVTPEEKPADPVDTVKPLEENNTVEKEADLVVRVVENNGNTLKVFIMTSTTEDFISGKEVILPVSTSYTDGELISIKIKYKGMDSIVVTDIKKI